VLTDDVARGVHSAPFAISYVALRSFMLALHWRAWRAVPEARPLIRLYGSGYALGAAVWLASLAVDTPLRYVVWGIALTLELSLPHLSTRTTAGCHDQREERPPLRDVAAARPCSASRWWPSRPAAARRR
jgi:low temperature requirement protein LtrA